MNLHLQSSKVEITIRKWARWYVDRLPAAELVDTDLEDVVQEFWLEAVQALEKFDTSTNVKFSTFLYSHLRFRATTMLRRRWNQRNNARRAGYQMKVSESKPADERLPETFLKEVLDGLKPREQKLLGLLIQPSEDLHHLLHVNNSDAKNHTVRNFHLAQCCGISCLQVSRSLKLIERRFQKVLTSR